MKTRTVVGLVLLVGVGVGARTLPPHSWSGLTARWPWTAATVTLYIPDGKFLVPVSRRIPANADLPRATLQAWIEGPASATGLKAPLPKGVGIGAFVLTDGVAYLDLSSAGEMPLTPAVPIAIVETLTALPGIDAVSVSANGRSVVDRGTRIPLLYYPSANGLVAVQTSASTPRAALTAYLAPPPDPDLTVFPSDVRLMKYEHDTDRGLVSVNFSYTRQIRSLALEQPDRTRLLLLGLIASLTEFSSVRAVRLDFEGQTRLGLGQCSDLIRTAQPRPALLNDERLLGR